MSKLEAFYKIREYVRGIVAPEVCRERDYYKKKLRQKERAYFDASLASQIIKYDAYSGDMDGYERERMWSDLERTSESWESWAERNDIDLWEREKRMIEIGKNITDYDGICLPDTVIPYA